VKKTLIAVAVAATPLAAMAAVSMPSIASATNQAVTPQMHMPGASRQAVASLEITSSKVVLLHDKQLNLASRTPDSVLARELDK